MRPRLILLCILIAILSNASAQTNELSREQIQKIKQLIGVFKTKDKVKIADFISYPLGREYPLKSVKDKNDFIHRFEEIFDKEFVDYIAKSKIEDWGEVGWRGIMFDDGKIWIDDDGKIVTVNYQSAKERQLLIKAIQDDKNQLPKSLQNFEKPVYLIYTKNYKIRIDENANNTYRYVAWKIKNQKIEPDIIIENGVLEFRGSGGNHSITFKNNGYTYIIEINVIGAEDTPEVELNVLKQEKTILTDTGTIKRN